jgi:peptide/nickel transport system permease protein
MVDNAIVVEPIRGLAPEKRGIFADFFYRLYKEKRLGLIGAIIFLIFLLTGIFADFLAPYGYNETYPVKYLKPPSAENWLGTDNLGRDLFSRVIYGARLSVIIGFAGTALSIVISVFLGIISGYFGGKTDMLLQRTVDAWMCFPGLVILIVAISIIGPGMWQVILVLGLQYGIAGSRIIRGTVVSTKENMYIAAARSIGVSNTRMLVRHILPNIMAPIIVLFSIRISTIILVEATLSFLGLGVPPPAPSWGRMLSGHGRTYMTQAPLLGIAPGLALTLVVYGVNVFGDALRDLLDPRLRGGIGSYAKAEKKRKKEKGG